MKLICAIALVLGLMMLREGIVLGVVIALPFALAVLLALLATFGAGQIISAGCAASNAISPALAR